jgi:ABC-type transport system involved in cytochrome c biogenesis ATPase subunit
MKDSFSCNLEPIPHLPLYRLSAYFQQKRIALGKMLTPQKASVGAEG